LTSYSSSLIDAPRGTAVATADVSIIEGGDAFFSRLVAGIERATRTIVFRCFDWRDDQTGELVARALLAAADRGVRVTIHKDLVGATYEYFEGSQQSFLHKDVELRTRLESVLLMLAYGALRWPRPRANPLAGALLSHSNITVERHRRRHDHSKVYVIDDETLFIGGVGIGDDERFANLDFMLEIEGKPYVARYHARNGGTADFDRERPLDFLVHSPATDGRHRCHVLDERLRLFASARSRITIEMAYFSDPRITNALIEAVSRGVAVTLVTGTRSNVIPDLKLATCRELVRRTGGPSHLRVVLHRRPVHSKAIVIDGRIADVGSTNFTRLSHGAYDEVDVYVQNAELAGAIEAVILRHASEGQIIDENVRYNRVRAALERAIEGHQARP
jgi:cardiolipin synthase